MKNKNVFVNFKGHIKIKVIGFISWSFVMILIGSLAGNHLFSDNLDGFGFSQVYAAPTPDSSNGIIRLDRNRLSGNNLGDYAPYEPESGDLIARGHDYFYSKDGSFGIGVWESKPGKIHYTNLEYDELMYILEGSMVMTDDKGHSEAYGVGEGLVLPKGWSGILTVPKGGVRKIWVSYMAGIKGQSN